METSTLVEDKEAPAEVSTHHLTDYIIISSGYYIVISYIVVAGTIELSRICSERTRGTIAPR